MGTHGAEIKFGIVSDCITFVPSPSASLTKVHVPHLPSTGCCSNLMPPTEFREDDLAARTSIFDTLTFAKRVINAKRGEAQKEPSFTIYTHILYTHTNIHVCTYISPRHKKTLTHT